MSIFTEMKTYAEERVNTKKSCLQFIDRYFKLFCAKTNWESQFIGFGAGQSYVKDAKQAECEWENGNLVVEVFLSLNGKSPSMVRPFSVRQADKSGKLIFNYVGGKEPEVDPFGDEELIEQTFKDVADEFKRVLSNERPERLPGKKKDVFDQLRDHVNAIAKR